MAYNSTYKGYITGLKGFACFMVMAGHFLGLLTYAESFPCDIALFLSFKNSKIGFVLNESYWLNLFLITSGYLLAFSRIEKIQQLLAKFIQRFLRLGLPIFFAYVFIYILYLSVGFHNGETKIILSNAWYQNYYSGDYSVLSVILSPVDVLIFGKCILNSPYWVLRDMFIASLVIYTVNYLFYKFSKKHLMKLIVGATVLIISLVLSNIVFSCFFGAILCWLEKNIKSIIQKQWFSCLVIICTFSLSFISQNFRSLFFFSSIIICVPRIRFLNKVLSSKIIQFFGDISFGIYSFHWPIYASVGAIILVDFYTKDESMVLISIIIAMLSSMVVTVVLSWIYHITFEKISGHITRKVYSLITRSISPHQSL